MFYRIEKKKLNLLAAYNRKEGPSKYVMIGRLVVIPLLIVALFGGAYASIIKEYRVLQEQVDEVKLRNEALQEEIDQCNLSEYDRYVLLQKEYTELQQIDSYLEAQPSISKNTINQIITAMYSGMSMNSINCNQASKSISINAVSSNVRNIEQYVTKLKKLPGVSDVAYNGYTQSTNSENKKVQYSFSIRITLGGE